VAPRNGPRTTALPSLDATWGTADPLTFVAAAPDRRWLVVCQARRDTNGDGVVRVEAGAQGELRGDALEGYVLDGAGTGFAVDAFGGSDPSGRYLAYVSAGRLVLRDTTTGVDAELEGADVDDDLSPFVHPRVVSFDPTGRRLLYLARTDGKSRIVVRDLASAAESTIEPGDGLLWRADFDPSGDWVVAHVVANDTNHDGRLGFPVRAAPKPWMRCAGPLPRFATWERPGDDPETRLAPAAGGSAVPVPALIAPFGEERLERDAEGAIIEVAKDGKKAVIVDKKCESRLVHVDGARGVAIVTCVDKKGHADARLVTGKTVKSLGFALAAAAGDHFIEGSPAVVPLHPGADAVLVDLAQGTTESLRTGDRILVTAGRRALVLRGSSLVLHELGGSERTLSGEVTPLAHVVHSLSVWYVPPYVIDVARGEVLGRSDARAFAVASDGALLVAGDADATRLSLGPLKWRAPTPEPATPAPPEVPVATGVDAARAAAVVQPAP
jgi:hypothetical protein